MSNLLRLLPWDTDFFGLKIGRIEPLRLEASELDAILETARREQYRCLYFQADPEHAPTISLVEAAGFHLVDVRIVLEHPFDGRPAPVPRYPISPEITLGPPQTTEKPTLSQIAVQIGHTSRFCFDRRFPPDGCARLYRAWLERVWNAPEDELIVARLEGQPVGLIAGSVDPPSRLGSIDLAGVERRWRGRGVGTALVQAALDWFKAQGASRVEVVTQTRNVPAQRLYQQMGFFTRRMTLYYHHWINPER